jgi:hypothetical protein
VRGRKFTHHFLLRNGRGGVRNGACRLVSKCLENVHSRSRGEIFIFDLYGANNFVTMWDFIFDLIFNGLFV